MFWKSWIGPLPQNWIDPKVAGNRTVSEKSSESLGTTKISISWHYLFLTLTFTKRCDDVTNLLFPPFVHFFSLSLLLYLVFLFRRITYPGEIPVSANFGNFADASLFLSDAIVSIKVPPPVISNFKHSSDVFWYPTQKFLWNRLNVNQKI